MIVSSRFLQPDPIGYAGGLNLYTYVGNNPLNWIDPWGLSKTWPWPKRWRWYHYPVAPVHAIFEVTAVPTEMVLNFPDTCKEAGRLGARRKRAVEGIIGGGPIPTTPGALGRRFSDWRRRITRDALAVPGSSLSGPVFAPTRSADFLIPAIEGSLKHCPSVDEEPQQ